MNEIELHEKITEVSKTIFSYCMAKTPTREEAEDLSQDILYELIKSAGNIRDDNAFYAFMWGVAGNVYKQWYRKKLRNNTCELTEDIASEDDSSEDNFGDIYLLRRELALLSEKYRKATIMYYIDRCSCSEIASALAISESMVKYLLFKSRKILKEGMNMERNLGELSYNPKTLIPMYSGHGPNQFWEFMQSKIRQNVVSACYNDALTVQQISLETGIPLPYLDDEIKELEDKQIILREGKHYKANVIIITSECADEIERAVTKYHEKIADKIEAFIKKMASEYKNLGFIGSNFSENTLRWQFAAILFMAICEVDYNEFKVPKTGWGEPAYLWCVEKLNEKFIFNYSRVDGKHGDSLYFFDYWKCGNGKGDHHDFYGNERYINIFCDICRGDYTPLSEYDLEAIAEMIKKGYVIKENETYRATVPIYTFDQYKAVVNMVQAFISNELISIIQELDHSAAKILSSHTPKHLQAQVAGIAAMDRFVYAVCIPATILIERQFLSIAWHPLEMPTTYVVLK
ncbi:MAG: sigma-70 family RNA polymerase sigma factor [Clostridia bacterium]|nr:sigma-70 family RNA polymerase sigma factor [Clostridia bacterium]